MKQQDCRNTAMIYLQRRDRSSFELMKHLRQRGFSEEEIAETLEFLSELHYIDDQRYCRHFIEYGLSKGRGPVRLQAELREKGIGADICQRILEEAFGKGKELEAAEREVGKILGSKASVQNFEWKENGPEEEILKLSSDKKELAKAARRLSALGYHSNIIFEAIERFRRD